MVQNRRVVVTGMGIVSSIGHSISEVTEALRQGQSGIQYCEDYEANGLNSHIAGRVHCDVDQLISRKYRRFMCDASAFAYVAMQQAIDDAGLTEDMVSHPRTGIIAGSGGASTESQVEAVNILKARGIRKVGLYRVTQTMASTVSACLATPFQIKGLNFSISSACATSAHCIGQGAKEIMMGNQDIIFAGGGESEHWSMTLLFDAMGALSTKYNDQPTHASRAYDANRDGFVIAGGAGMLVLESYDHAKARGAKIYGELLGYGASSDGYNMVAPSGEGAVRCMEQALSTVDGPIDYINAHGTSTPVGDVAELEAIRGVFNDKVPAISSTKSLTGHSLGATGVQEAIFSLIMMNEGFVSASANVETLDPKAEGLDIVQSLRETSVDRVLSNSFGFGGTNASLVFQKV